MAMKPESFLISVVSVSVGTTLAIFRDPIHWWKYFLTVLGMLSLHGGTNVINDYFDYKNKVDTAEVSGGYGTERRVLVQKWLLPSHVLGLGLFLFSISLGIGAYLAWIKGPVVFALGAVGFLAGFFTPPIQFRSSIWLWGSQPSS